MAAPMHAAVRELQGPTGVTHALRGRFGSAHVPSPSAPRWGLVFIKRTSLELYNVRANPSQARLNLLSITSLPSPVMSAAALRRPSVAHDFLWLGFSSMRVAAMAWDDDAQQWHTLQVVDVGAVVNRLFSETGDRTRDSQRPMSSVPGDEHLVLIRGRYSDSSAAQLKVDDKGRCVGVLAKELETLVVLPMRSDTDLSAAAANPATAVSQSALVEESDIFTVDLHEDYGVGNVKDYVFLDDSFEPIVVLLYEPKRTWAGRVSVLKNTAELVAISIDLKGRSHSKAWEMQNLPSDAHHLVAVPGSAGGGVLVLSPNVLMQVRHEACAAGLSLNSFGDEYAIDMQATYGAIAKSDSLMSLDSARVAFLDDHQGTAVVSLKGGELYFLTVASSTCSAISMIRAGSTVLTASIVPINSRFFVLASRLSDSLLIEYRQGAAAGAIGEEQEHADGVFPSVIELPPSNQGNSGCVVAEPDNSMSIDNLNRGGASDKGAFVSTPGLLDETARQSSSKKRKRTAEEAAEYEMLYGSKPPSQSGSVDDDGDGDAINLELIDKDEGTRGVYDDDDELGAVFHSDTGDRSVRNNPARALSWSLVVKDTLTGYGPAADLTVGRSPGDADGGALDVVVAGGFAKNGCLGVLQHTLRPHDITRFVLSDFTQAWTVRDPSLSKREAVARDARNLKRAAMNLAVRERNTATQLARDKWVSDRLGDLKAPKSYLQKAGSADPGISFAFDDGDMPGDSASGVEPLNKRAKVIDDRSENVLGGNIGERVNGLSVVEKVDEFTGDCRAKDDSLESHQEHKAGVGNDKAFAFERHQTGPTATQVAEIESEAAQDFPLEVEEVLEDVVSDVSDLHSYLLLGKPNATVVMKTGDDLEELGVGVVDFLTDVGTFAAGNVLGEVAIIQVHAQGVRLIKDSRVVVEHFLAPGSPVVGSAQVSDPFVMLLLANGGILVLRVSASVVDVAVTVSDMNRGADGGEYGTRPFCENDAGKAVKEYRNFQLVVEYAYEPEQPGNAIFSACLYRGPLASASKRELSQGNSEKKVVDDVTHADKRVGEFEGAKYLGDAGVQTTEHRSSDSEDMDEEDFMLYGDGGSEKEVGNGKPGELDRSVSPRVDIRNSSYVPSGVTESRSGASASESGIFPLPSAIDVRAAELGEATLLVTTTKDGALEMRSMESASHEIVFRCAHFFLAPQLVVDDGISALTPDPRETDASATDRLLKAKKKDRITSLTLTHVTGTALVPGLSTPLLVAVQASGFPLIYRAFVSSNVNCGSLAVSRVHLSRVACSGFTTEVLRGASSHPGRVPLVPFKNVAGRGGIFVGGVRPFFVFAERGFPRIHPVRCNFTTEATQIEVQRVSGFAELHNVNCPRGFVTIQSDGVVGVSELPTPGIINTDAPTPFRKVPLRCTPHKVAYHAGSSTYGVLASMPTLTTREDRLARILQSLEKHDKRHYESTVAQAEAETGDDRLVRIPPLFEELHELRIYRPDGWQLIKSFKLQKGEVGLSIANISVDVWKKCSADSGVHIPSTNRLEDGSESPFAASIKMRPKNMLVVGTGFLNGEDATSRGRLLMFEVSRQEVFAEGSGVYTAFQLQLIAEKELSAPVSAVAPMQGYVVAGVGPQLGVYKLVEDEIVYLSFAFGQLFCTSIASLNQYVVSADMYKSVAFHFFRDRNTSVNFLGKDFSHISTYASEFLVHNDEMSIILSDAVGNLHMLGYANANVPESRGGKRLLLNGGVNYGSRVNKFQRVRLTHGASPASVSSSDGSGQHATIFATLDGGLGAIVPMAEKQFHELSRLSEVMIDAADVVRHAGVDPKDARTFRPANSSTQLLNQRLIDTRLALEALLLQPSRARIVSKMAGLDSLDDLVSLFSCLDAVLARF